MKARIIILIITLGLQLTLAFFPKIPKVREMMPSDTVQRQVVESTLFVVGLSLAIMGLAHNLNAIVQEQSAEKLRARVAATLPAIVMQKQRDDEFYTTFEYAIRTSESSVNICYFAPEPPKDHPDADRKRYYRTLVTQMRNRKEVAFRRIVRSTSANRVWVKELAKTFEGRGNVSLALIDEPEGGEMPLALSVQIVDGRKTWLVAIESHNRTGAYRDLYVEGEVFADAMGKYFDRLWKLSTIVLDNGRIKDRTFVAGTNV